MSGGSRTTSSTSGSTQPWKEAQPNLKLGLGDAKDLYQSGQGFQPYTGSTVVPYSQQTTGAMDNIMAKADMSQEGSVKPFNAFSQQMDYLSPIARGDFSQDQTFNQTLGAAQRDAFDAVNMGAAAAGRYGSAVHQGNVAREVGELTNRAKLDRQRWAQQGLQGAAQGLSQGFDMAFRPEQMMMNVGGMNEDLMARQMQDEMRIYEEEQMAPWRRLEQFNAINSGAGSLGGTSRSQVQEPRNYGSAFGNALIGSQFGPIGAGLGFASGLF